VTSCNHAFCLKHENDERIQQSTCPGCGSHLPSKGGMHRACFRAPKDEARKLCGLQPDSIFAMASNAIDFWVMQERTRADAFEHSYGNAKKAKDDQKESFKRVHENVTQELAAARQLKDQSDARCEELKQELQLLEEKYTEETRKVRVMQERMIDWKRKRGDSPMHQASLASPEHHQGGPRQRMDGSSSACAYSNHRSSPMHIPNAPMPRAMGGSLSSNIGGTGIGGGFGSGGGFSRHASPTPHRAPSLTRLPSLGGGNAGNCTGSSASRFGATSFHQLTTPTTCNSRQGTPTHRSFGGSAFSYGGRR